MIFWYNVFIRSYAITLWLASWFNTKAKKWVQGRQNLFSEIESKWSKSDKKVIWFHCASLGEFEQGRPLIDSLYDSNRYRIFLTFFSPSGYEIRQDYPKAHYISYLPLDTSRNAQRFLGIVQPDVVVFVKYEIWYHLLHQAQERGIPTFLVSAQFRTEQFYFRWYGKPFLKVLHNFERIFVQNEASLQVLQSNRVENGIIAGDTRIDRVWQIAQNTNTFPIVETFVGVSPTLVAGSTWAADEALLLPFIQQAQCAGWQIIIAPHEIDEAHLRSIEQQLQIPHIRFSLANTENIRSKRVLIIDNIGMLSSLYQYANIAYIGGGFGDGIHNILEASVFEIPVIFGPKYKKFEEAVTLVAKKGGFEIVDFQTLDCVWAQLQNTSIYQNASRVSRQFIHQNKGASQLILPYLDIERKTAQSHE